MEAKHQAQRRGSAREVTGVGAARVIVLKQKSDPCSLVTLLSLDSVLSEKGRSSGTLPGISSLREAAPLLRPVCGCPLATGGISRP